MIKMLKTLPCIKLCQEGLKGAQIKLILRTNPRAEHIEYPTEPITPQVLRVNQP